MWEINRRTVSGFKTMFWRTAVLYVYIYLYKYKFADKF